MRIAIIGSNSLVAKYLIEKFLFNQDVSLTLFGRTAPQNLPSADRITFREFNFPDVPVDADELATHNAIIYCAASGVQAGENVSAALMTAINQELPLTLREVLSQLEYKGKWISFGSYFELGNSPLHHAADETAVLSNEFAVPNDYCQSKRNLSAAIAGQETPFYSWHLILPTVYGKYEHQNRLIPYLIHTLQHDELPRLGAGKQVRQYIHGHDIANLVSLLLTKEIPSGIYNVAGPDTLPIKELVQLIFARFERSALSSLGVLQTRDESMPFLQLDGRKLHNALPEWEPEWPLAVGLDEYFYKSSESLIR